MPTSDSWMKARTPIAICGSQHEDSTVALRTACAKAFTLTDALNRAEVPSVHERAQAQSVAEVKRRASRQFSSRLPGWIFSTRDRTG